MVNVPAADVLPGLGTAGWTRTQGVAYEVAQEAVRQAIGYYAHLIASQEAVDEPDLAAIAEWRDAQQAWAARGQEFTPLDTAAIKRVRADADDLLSVEVDDDDGEDKGEGEGDRG